MNEQEAANNEYYEYCKKQKGRFMMPAKNAVSGIKLTILAIIICSLCILFLYILIFANPEMTFTGLVLVPIFYTIRTIARDIWEIFPFE